MAWKDCRRNLDNFFRDRTIRELSGIIAEVVRLCRRHNDTMKAAEHDAAEILGITPRRLRSWRAAEVFSVTVEEAELIRSSRLKLAEYRCEQLRKELAVEEARLRAVTDEWMRAANACLSGAGAD
ncbi:conserved protein of unknown function (plasmid) [Rhodovastum atsumiense]|nr:conserved protein of unknown function [Rhodovastum atsumiense]